MYSRIDAHLLVGPHERQAGRVVHDEERLHWHSGFEDARAAAEELELRFTAVDESVGVTLETHV